MIKHRHVLRTFETAMLILYLNILKHPRGFRLDFWLTDFESFSFTHLFNVRHCGISRSASLKSTMYSTMRFIYIFLYYLLSSSEVGESSINKASCSIFATISSAWFSINSTILPKCFQMIYTLKNSTVFKIHTVPI